MQARKRSQSRRARAVSPRERSRRRGYHLLARGVRKAEIARQLHVPWKRVWEWDHRREKMGPRSWRDTPPPGRPSKLVPSRRASVETILVKGAQAYGYPTELWTLKPKFDSSSGKILTGS